MTDRSRLRLVILGVLVVSLVATLIGRLWYLQVIAAPQFRSEAFSSQTRDIVTEAPRGEIVDDKGRPLVTNKSALVITVNRTKLSEQRNCSLPAPAPTSTPGSTTSPAPPPGPRCPVLKRLSHIIRTPYRRLVAETTPCSYPRETVKVRGRLIHEKVATPAHCYNGPPSQPIPVSQVKGSAAATRRTSPITDTQERYPGVTAQTVAVRHYPRPDGADASTILGYTSPINADQFNALSPAKQRVEMNTRVGVTGLEQSYEKYLHGKPGVKQITVDHLGAQTGVVKNTAPRQGDDLVTWLDAKAQADLEHEVQAAITYGRAHNQTADYASGVVLDARTGGIVAMASEPTYNPNRPPSSLTTAQYERLRHSEGHPLFDKAYGSSYPPGSTFKPISASGMLWDGTITTGGEYDCPTTFGTRHNFDQESGAGIISLHRALVISCDTFFFKLGATDYNHDETLIGNHQPPREGVQKLAREYGYGSTLKNGYVDLPNVSDGHVADRQNTKLFWQANAHRGLNYCKGARNPTFGASHRELDREFCETGYVFEPGDQENEDVGQGTVLASPLQVAVAYAAIANGGTVFEPRVVKAIVDPATGAVVKRITPPVRDHVSISPYDLQYLRDSLYGVTHETGGTATSIFASANFPFGQVDVGGKTGTAELTGTNENGSWFASFGGRPGAKPRYVTVIEVDKSDQGAVSAAPFVVNMYEDLYGLNGKPAVFKNGVPPTKLPKVGVAAERQRMHRDAKRHHAAGRSGTGGTSPGPNGTPTGSPTTTADGLPPDLAWHPGRPR